MVYALIRAGAGREALNLLVATVPKPETRSNRMAMGGRLIHHLTGDTGDFLIFIDGL